MILQSSSSCSYCSLSQSQCIFFVLIFSSGNIVLMKKRRPWTVCFWAAVEKYFSSQKCPTTHWYMWISSGNEVIKSQPFFPFHSFLPSNLPHTAIWSSVSYHCDPLKMSLASENGSVQKSIKGSNVVSLLWLSGFLSAFQQVTLFHFFLIVSARPKTGRKHYV